MPRAVAADAAVEQSQRPEVIDAAAVGRCVVVFEGSIRQSQAGVALAEDATAHSQLEGVGVEPSGRQPVLDGHACNLYRHVPQYVKHAVSSATVNDAPGLW